MPADYYPLARRATLNETRTVHLELINGPLDGLHLDIDTGHTIPERLRVCLSNLISFNPRQLDDADIDYLCSTLAIYEISPDYATCQRYYHVDTVTHAKH